MRSGCLGVAAFQDLFRLEPMPDRVTATLILVEMEGQRADFRFGGRPRRRVNPLCHDRRHRYLLGAHRHLGLVIDIILL